MDGAIPRVFRHASPWMGQYLGCLHMPHQSQEYALVNEYARPMQLRKVMVRVSPS